MPTPIIERGKKYGRDQSMNADPDLEHYLNVAKRWGPKKGMYCQAIEEPTPQFDRAPCEKVLGQGALPSNNCYIVLGRDRPASLASGYGGAGMTQCGMIDLVVGRQSSYKNKKGIRSVPGRSTITGPNFFSDAARIYISQKCNIDDYFGLAVGSERVHPISGRSNSLGRSGIGIKADHVRIIGRRHIKLITSRAPVEGMGRTGEKLGTGGENFGDPGGIDLIAGNYTEAEPYSKINKITKVIGFDEPLFTGDKMLKLQPLVKGDNLIECIRWIDMILANHAAMIYANSKGISKSIRAQKRFMSTFPIRPGMRIIRKRLNFPKIKAFQTLAATINGVINSVGLEANFLRAGSPLYINSRHVKTT